MSAVHFLPSLYPAQPAYPNSSIPSLPFPSLPFPSLPFTYHQTRFIISPFSSSSHYILQIRWQEGDGFKFPREQNFDGYGVDTYANTQSSFLRRKNDSNWYEEERRERRGGPRREWKGKDERQQTPSMLIFIFIIFIYLLQRLQHYCTNIIHPWTPADTRYSFYYSAILLISPSSFVITYIPNIWSQKKIAPYFALFITRWVNSPHFVLFLLFLTVFFSFSSSFLSQDVDTMVQLLRSRGEGALSRKRIKEGHEANPTVVPRNEGLSKLIVWTTNVSKLVWSYPHPSPPLPLSPLFLIYFLFLVVHRRAPKLSSRASSRAKAPSPFILRAVESFVARREWHPQPQQAWSPRQYSSRQTGRGIGMK